MTASNEHWDMISSQLQQAAAKAATIPARFEASFDHGGDSYPCWVPSFQCLTVDAAETLLDVAS